MLHNIVIASNRTWTSQLDYRSRPKEYPSSLLNHVRWNDTLRQLCIKMNRVTDIGWNQVVKWAHHSTNQFKAGGVRTYNSGLNWCAHALHLAGVAILEFALHSVQVLFGPHGLSLYLEQVNIDTIIWHKKRRKQQLFTRASQCAI